MQKEELRTLTPYIKINSEMYYRSKYKSPNYKIPRNQYRNKASWPWVRWNILRCDTKKHKWPKKLDIIKIKTFYPQWTPSKEGNYNLHMGRKLLQIIFLIKYLYLECIKSSYKSTIKRHPLKKWAKDLNKTVLQRRFTNGQSTWKDAEDYQTSGKCQIKTTVIHYFIPTRMSMTKKTDNKIDNLERLELFYIVDGNVKWCSFFGKCFCTSLKG